MLTPLKPLEPDLQPGRQAKTTKRPCVLLTGFEAFGASRAESPQLNPSWLAIAPLHGDLIAGHQLVSARLPCAFGASLQQLGELLELHHPALVIAVGQAGGRHSLSLERVAINVDDASQPDNAGFQPIDQPVLPEGPAAYFSSLPIKAMLRDLRQAGFKAEVSQSAGTYVCNHVFYGLMHALATQPALAGSRGGFVHVPYLPEQGEPSLALADTTAALRMLVASALATSADVALTGGALS
jgi:pyroglutamyl-peptidase